MKRATELAIIRAAMRWYRQELRLSYKGPRVHNHITGKLFNRCARAEREKEKQ